MQILKYCSVTDAEITEDSKLVFKSNEKDLKPFLKEFYKSEKLECPKFYKMDAQCKLAFIAAEVLFRNIDREQYQNEEIAMVFANSESTLATDMSYWESTKDIASPGLFVYTLPNILIGEIAIKNKIKGENYFFVSENFDAQLLHEQTEMIFQNTATKLVVVGWVNYESETNYCAKLFLVSKSEIGMYPFTIDNINNLNK